MTIFQLGVDRGGEFPFVPKEDITTDELAEIIAIFFNLQNKRPSNFIEKATELPSNVVRHFVGLQQAIDNYEPDIIQERSFLYWFWRIARISQG